MTVIVILSIVLFISISINGIQLKRNIDNQYLIQDCEKLLIKANKRISKCELLEKEFNGDKLTLNKKIEEFRTHNKALNQKIINLKRELRKYNEGSIS